VTYLDDIADAIRARVPGEMIPSEDTDALFRLYAVLALAKGPAVEPADVHDAWAAWMRERDPDHPSIRPFDELDADTRRMDEPFAQAIRIASAERGLRAR
jgi:hypothetical protein